jgi:multidrug resistance efflux pump
MQNGDARPAQPARIRFELDPADATKPVAYLHAQAEAKRAGADVLEAELATHRKKLEEIAAEAQRYRDAALEFDNAAELLMRNGYADAEADQKALPLAPAGAVVSA